MDPTSATHTWEVAPLLADLVVTGLEVVGPSTVNAKGNIEIPIRVLMANQGQAIADGFKVSMDYTGGAGSPSSALAVPFTVPGQNSVWYPYTNAPLSPGGTITFEGIVTFNSTNLGQTVALRAEVDSCSGDEIMPNHCRVDESNEGNNYSSWINVPLPRPTDSVDIISISPAPGTTIESGQPFQVQLHYTLFSTDKAVLALYIEQFPGTAEGCQGSVHQTNGGTNVPITRGEHELSITVEWLGDTGSGYLTAGVNFWTYGGDEQPVAPQIKAFGTFPNYCYPFSPRISAID
jgi:hypothetical protein